MTGPRSSRVTRDNIEFGFWLVFDESGSMRLTRTEPVVGRTERSMFATATLPLSLWSTPTLRATFNVKPSPEGGFTVNLDIAADALRSALGVDVDLKVIDKD